MSFEPYTAQVCQSVLVVSVTFISVRFQFEPCFEAPCFKWPEPVQHFLVRVPIAEPWQQRLAQELRVIGPFGGVAGAC
jgi:hypothetical protein